MITQEQLQEWRQLTDAATPGEWEEVAESGEWWLTTCADDKGTLCVIPDTQSMNQADVDFIAAARTAVPTLLDALAAATQRAEAAEAALAAVPDYATYYMDAWDEWNEYNSPAPLDFAEWLAAGRPEVQP